MIIFLKSRTYDLFCFLVCVFCYLLFLYKGRNIKCHLVGLFTVILSA